MYLIKQKSNKVPTKKYILYSFSDNASKSEKKPKS